MNQYNNLLAQVAKEFSIWKGTAEKEIEWKCRLIYSVCGLMGYASSWDSTIQENPSIEHFKSRIKSVFESYISIYPELQFKFCDPNALAEEIYNIFVAAGAIYHLDHHVCPPPFKHCQMDDVILTRGAPIDNIRGVSGLGTLQSDEPLSVDATDFYEMFQIDATPLADRWASILKEARWELLEVPSDAEYLKMDFSHRGPYWLNTPDKNAPNSLMRIKTETGTLFYLYKYDGDRLYGSRLADWQTENNGIRNYSNSCLAAYNVLPPITYKMDGNCIQFKPGYLLPPAENNFVKLYSWPTDYIEIDRPFQARKCTPSVFQILYMTFTLKGYTFEKE